MKKNLVSKNKAVPRHDHGAVCEIIVRSSGGVITGGVNASRIDWNGIGLLRVTLLGMI